VKAPAVYIIGAGPGDPGLITVRGLECLRGADVVVHDHLVPSQLIRQARNGVEVIDVGVAAPRLMAQEAINYLLVEKAREGRVVARLKWGDPFVFDGGGDEARFLHERNVPFEVVPGVPAGIGVPTYAGIPVTYPEGIDSLTLVRGYEDERRTVPDIDWSSLVRLGGTIVCYAGAQQLPRILDALRSNGWPPDGDAAIVYNGTMTSQTCVTGTISNLITVSLERPRREPAILVVGDVVALRTQLRWYDNRPLFGRRVLVTRPREQAAELVDRLTALGAEAIEAPMIRIDPPDDPGPLQRAAEQPQAFDAIVFSSANAVDAFMTRFLDGGRDLRALHGPLLCAVGTGTARRLQRYALNADIVPDEFRGEAVAGALARRGQLGGRRVLLPRSDIGREVIAEQLRSAGAIVTEVVAYRTVLDETQSPEGPDIYGMLLHRRIDVATFTSASAVRNFVKVYGADQAADLLAHTVVAAIGPVTADAAAELGITVTVQPGTYTVPALVDAIVAHFANQPGDSAP
jgi:uroporphyrinogen III methyltransferase / synthase